MSFVLKDGAIIRDSNYFKITRIQDIPNLEGWWIPGQGTYELISPSLDPAEDGDTVYRWVDTINSRNFDQAAVANRPKYFTNVVNGLPVIRFAASSLENRFFVNGTLPNSDGTNGASLFVVVKYTGTYPSTTNNEGGLYIFGNWVRYPNNLNTITDVFRSNTTRTFTPTLAINQWRVISVRSKTNLKTFYLNNALQDSTTTNTYSASTTRYIGYNSLTSFVGDIGDLLYYSRYVTDSERTEIATYLMTKYGLT
ncbi:MAG: hypothetical protein ACO3EZ_16735 [Prochlorotrichaceae cyanobacterium]